MNFQYQDQLPTLPTNILNEIYQLVEKPADVQHTSKELQLNSVDQQLLDTLKDSCVGKEDSLGVSMELASLHYKNLATFDFLEVNDIIKEWVHNNITPTPSYISIQCMKGGSIITPHIDEVRSWVYNYIIETGEAVTKFYNPKKEYNHLIAYPQTVFTVDGIEEVDAINIEANRWHYLNVSNIHNVENIVTGGRRLSLSLSYA